MGDYFRDLNASTKAGLAAVLDHDTWSDIPQPVRLNLRARKTNLDPLLE